MVIFYLFSVSLLRVEDAESIIFSLVYYNIGISFI